MKLTLWYSLHGFIHNFEAIDNYLNKYFDFVESPLIFEYFFIRYWEGGPHIRLRFKCDPSNYSVIYQKFQDSINRFLNENKVSIRSPLRINQKKMAELEGKNTNNIIYPSGNLQEIKYEPEINRYGGSQLEMSKSESIFVESSKLCYRLNKLNKNYRILVALELMDFTFKQNGVDKLRNNLENYKSFWSIYKNNSLNFIHNSAFIKTFNKIKNNEIHYNIYNSYIEKIQETKVCNDINILASHVHMTNNRLGITPDLEYAIASFLLDKYNEVEVNEMEF